MVLFGATGDLTHRLVIPALYNLARTNALPENFALIGVARTQTTTKPGATNCASPSTAIVGAPPQFVDPSTRRWAGSPDKMLYLQGDISDPDFYDTLRGVLDKARHATAEPKATRCSTWRSPRSFLHGGGAPVRGEPAEQPLDEDGHRNSGAGW